MSSISSECIRTSRGTRSFLEPVLTLQNMSPESEAMSEPIALLVYLCGSAG